MKTNLAMITPAENALPEPAAEKPRVKRLRMFHVDVRTVPSRLGAFFGGVPSDWELHATYSKLADARRAQHAFTVLEDTKPFARRTEYRVRRTNKKVA